MGYMGTSGVLWVALGCHFGWHFRVHFRVTLCGTLKLLWVVLRGHFGWHFGGTLGGALGEVDSEMPTMAPFCSSLLEQTHRNYQVYVVITPEIMILRTFIIP